ncbi:MAG: hypothetical protein LBF12_00200 [Christensenellaceae bacterium]|jgi:hypothetical protein|nr:hypothetical protein [Christensenellaceae bacterium]
MIEAKTKQNLLVWSLKKVFDKKDDRKHFKYTFLIDSNNYDSLIILFRYNPKDVKVDERLKMCLTELAIKSDCDAELLIKENKELKNLITLSIDSPHGYLGAAHRHNNNAKIIINQLKSSQGFLPSPITKGLWAITLSTHCILSNKVDVKIEVYAQ